MIGNESELSGKSSERENISTENARNTVIPETPFLQILEVARTLTVLSVITQRKALSCTWCDRKVSYTAGRDIPQQEILDKCVKLRQFLICKLHCFEQTTVHFLGSQQSLCL